MEAERGPTGGREIDKGTEEEVIFGKTRRGKQ